MSAIFSPGVFKPVLRSVVLQGLQIFGGICLLLAIDVLALAIAKSHGIDVPASAGLAFIAGQIVGCIGISVFLALNRQATRSD